MQCADEADKKTYNCNEHYETLAVTAATLYGILLVLSVLEMLVSFLTSAYSSTFRAFCKRAFFTADDSYTPEVRVFSRLISLGVRHLEKAATKLRFKNKKLDLSFTSLLIKITHS